MHIRHLGALLSTEKEARRDGWSQEQTLLALCLRSWRTSKEVPKPQAGKVSRRVLGKVPDENGVPRKPHFPKHSSRHFPARGFGTSLDVCQDLHTMLNHRLRAPTSTSICLESSFSPFAFGNLGKASASLLLEKLNPLCIHCEFTSLQFGIRQKGRVQKGLEETSIAI